MSCYVLNVFYSVVFFCFISALEWWDVYYDLTLIMLMAMLRLYLLILHSTTYCIGRFVMTGTVYKGKKGGAFCCCLYLVQKICII